MVKVYVEGGGDIAALKASLRDGLHTFLKRAGLRHQPTIVACGSRRNAYERFCLAVQAGERAFLLVDSEAPIADIDQTDKPDAWRPWHHLRTRHDDGWNKPSAVDDLRCHLMVQCMETWIITDPGCLATFYGQGFSSNALPKTKDVESVSKASIFAALAIATKACRSKRPYDKSQHSFKLLALVDPAKVIAASPWAARFVDAMKKEMGS